MWYAGAAQQNGAAYLLAFCIGSVMLVSWLHARQHLAGLSVEAGSLPPVREGERLSLPLTIRSANVIAATGIEISSPQASHPVFVEQVRNDAPARLNLQMRPDRPGSNAKITVVIRSRYPLGFFTTEKLVQIDKPHLIHPKPNGDRPLPTSKPVAPHAQSQQTLAPAGRIGVGDDFNGVRAWAPGDSLRHVDWKAVARGRPMMVKEFTGGEAEEIALKWHQLEGNDESKASQIAKWIDEAESLGLNYSLSLPTEKLKSGAGKDHRRRCLDALARCISQSTTASQVQNKTRSHAPTLETSVRAPGRPLLMLAITAILLALPLIGSVPHGGPVIFFSALLIRWWAGQKVHVSVLWKVLLIAAGLTMVWGQTGTLRGLEQGIAFMLMLTGAKVLESRTPRDLQVLALLEWFLCLCALVLEQNLGRTLYIAFVTWLILLALVRMRRGTAGLKPPITTTLVLSAQALPLIVLLFFVFPRGTAGLVTSLTRSLQHESGLSEDLNPGHIAKVAASDAPAFRVTITQGNVQPNELYWRCFTLINCDGLAWQRGPLAGTHSRSQGSGNRIRQLISLEPHGGTWLPALDRPVQFTRWGRDYSIETLDRTLKAESPIRFAKRYEIESDPSIGAEDLSYFMRVACLRVPTNISSNVQSLVEEWKRTSKNDEQIVQASLKHYRTGGFNYTLQPGEYRSNTLDEFLFERKLGFCEHFAASFATLMRVAGIPARLVIGFQGGEPFGDYYMVRQYNAHAWAEVYLEKKGWVRIDPTAELAPARLTPDFRSIMEESFAGGFNIPRNTWWGRAILEARMRWDNLNYQWFSNVVQFNEDEQFLMFDKWGLGDIMRLATFSFCAIVVFVIVLWLWLRRKARTADPAVRLWEQVCARMAKHGFSRAPSEGPLSFGKRVPQIADFAKLYTEHRYGPEPIALDRLRKTAKDCLSAL